MNHVTLILQNIEQGEAEASASLLPLVYDELRRLAARELCGDGSGNSLQPTALVHEAYLRLVDQTSEPRWSHRGHFYAAAAEAMRRILVERARQKKSLKRGGDCPRLPLEVNELASPQRHPDLVALDEALTLLEESQPKIARLVSLRYFGGLSMQQAANALQMSLRTAERNWAYAKVWLLEALQNEE